MNASKYFAVSTSIVLAHESGEQRIAAEVADHASAKNGADMLNKARFLNDVKRRYTDSARMFAKAELLPGFRWID